jgi:hypothetical protein
MAYREITDGDGRLWRVWDTYPQTGGRGVVSDEYAEGWLTFETENEKRRLAPVPTGWSTLEVAALFPLLDRSEPVTRGTAQ